MNYPVKLVKHKASGKIHKVLEIYHEHDPVFGKSVKAGEKMVVTVQTNFVSEPSATTESWLGDAIAFMREFENAK